MRVSYLQSRMILVAFILLYLATTIAIGLWASRKVHNSRDFVLAGRQMPMLVGASALFATWFGSETILGATAEFAEGGVLAVIEDPFGAALCLMLVGAFFARRLYRENILTFNDYYRQRYNAQVELVSALFMVPSYFGWIAAQLVAMAIIFQTVAGVPFYAGILICTLVVLVYTYKGGMWSVSITDFIQTILIISGLLAVCWSLYQQTGGWAPVVNALPDHFFQFTPELKPMPVLHWVAAWITIGLGSIPQQDIFQRVMSVRSEKAAVRASWISGGMYLTIAMIPLAIVLFGRHLYPELITDNDQGFLPALVLAHSSLPVQVLFFGALLSAILSTTSGAILAPATVIGENIIRPRMKNPTDEHILRVIRFSVIGVALASVLMASWNADIYDLVAQSSALSLVSLFIPLTAGFYWPKATSTGAMCAMLAGMVAWLICEWIGTEIPAILYGLGFSILGMFIGSSGFLKSNVSPHMD